MNVKLFFNFRSPYCYLASKTLFDVLEKRKATLEWRPLGGWDGRSSPDRAKVKVPLTRQDVARWARRMKIPCQPPPISTEPTLAGLGSLLAEERGVLRSWVEAVMHAEWGEGRDIGDRELLFEIGARLELERPVLASAFDDETRKARLAANWREAQELGVMGVPTFVAGDQIFWGNDRVDFLDEYLAEETA